MTRLLSFILALAALTVRSEVYSSTVTLAWDPSPPYGNETVHYRVYYGVASGAYTNHVEAGTNLTVQVRSLKTGTTYYFAATATTTSGLESLFSNEVAYTTPLPPITGLVLVNATLESSTDGTNWTVLTNFSARITGPTNPATMYRSVMGINKSTSPPPLPPVLNK